MIAVVDDDASVRTASKELLRSMGFNAVTFGSAEEFLQWAGRADIDCLITDVHLPGMNGPALVRTLAGAGAALPSILITAHDDPTTLELIRQTGPVPYLRKPFSDDQLFDAIQRALAA
jgi:FixJ family two-component response regulator